jgi:hypothetical protein
MPEPTRLPVKADKSSPDAVNYNVGMFEALAEEAAVGIRVTSLPLSASNISTAGGASAFSSTAALTPTRSAPP